MKHLQSLLFFSMICAGTTPIAWHLYQQKKQRAGFVRVYGAHIRQIDYLDVATPPRWIVFSTPTEHGAIPVANQLVHQLQALRIAPKEIGALLEQHQVGSANDKTLLLAYISYFLTQVNKISDNRCVVIAGSIDTMYNHILAHTQRAGLPLFIIRSMDAPPTTTTPQTQAYQHLARHYPHQISIYFSPKNWQKQSHTTRKKTLQQWGEKLTT